MNLVLSCLVLVFNLCTAIMGAAINSDDDHKLEDVSNMDMDNQLSRYSSRLDRNLGYHDSRCKTQ